MKINGIISFGVFIYSWVGSLISIPASLVLSYYNYHYLTYSILFYYIYRYFIPCRYSQYWKELLMLKDYFNSENIILDKDAYIPEKNSKKMICVSPHGILPMGFSILLTSYEFNKTFTKWLVTDSMTLFPFLNDFLVSRNILSCSSSNMKKIMKNGDNIGIIPGGYEEATNYERGINKIYIKNRKGFIKYALQFDYNIIPVYVFGEEYMYWMNLPSYIKNISIFLNKYKIPGVMFIGKYFTFFPDNNIDVNIVIGKELKLPHISNPCQNDVNKYHTLYINSMVELFENNVEKYGNNKDLKIL